MKSCSIWLCCVAMISLFAVGCGGGGSPSGGGTSSKPSSDSSSKAGDNDEGSGSGTTASDSAADSGEEISTEGWGNLKGKFLVTGAPEPAKISVTADVAYCGTFTLVQESVVAGPNGELANVVLMPFVQRGDSPLKKHESYANSADEPVVINNKGCRFEPHVALMQAGQTLIIENSDTVGHNTKIDSPNNPINPIIPPGQKLEEKGFTKAERLPVGASCSIHPWMNGWLVVTDSPYMAASGENGEFLIENLPAGKHTFTVWHEKGGYISDVNIDGAKTSWSRGRVEVVIKDGETTDLGEVTITYADLADQCTPNS